MTSVLVSPEREDCRSSKDLPHLSLTLDSPASASPFPSPSSSFVPPPMLEPREFAAKLPIPKKAPMTTAATVSTGANGHAQPTPVLRDAANASSNPTTPTPGSKPDRPPSPATPKVNGSSLPVPSKIDTDLKGKEQEPELPLTPRRTKHTSLSSSRPAPPSPSISRRTSGAPSSRPVSRAPSMSMSTRRASRISSASRLSQVLSSSTPCKASPPPIKIRDFAYPADDLRHTGQGPDAPRLSVYSTVSDASDSRRSSGWGAFRWAGSRLWSFGLGGIGNGNRSQEGSMPSRSDFERNFDISSPADESSSFGYHQYENDNDRVEGEEEEYDDDGMEDAEGEDIPLFPGLYRALYAFEPEGTAEMALQEDQIIRVIGRGGGVGWAVVVKEDSGGGLPEVQHALVPESYLEPFQLDEASPETEAA